MNGRWRSCAAGGFGLPVVNAQGRVIGLVSLDDILMLLAGELDEIGQLLEQETPRFVTTGRQQAFANDAAESDGQLVSVLNGVASS